MDKNFKMRETLERIDEIKARLGEIAGSMDAEAREMTDAEKAERIQLERELNIKQMQVMANTKTIEVNRDNIEDANKQMREALKAGQRFELKIQRDTFGGNASNSVKAAYVTPAPNNPAPLTMGDIVEPLYEGLILSKIGMPLLTGLKGDYVWPIVEAFEATIVDETVALGDTKIPLSKLQAHPERIGVAVPVTREALNETDNLIQLICTKYMPVALAALLNKIMFSASAVTGATTLVGPFVTMKSGHSKTYATAAPTLADIIALRGLCLNEGITAEGEAYVMNETTKSKLVVEAMSINAAGAIVSGMGDTMPVIGGAIETLDFIPDNVIIFGYDGLYLMAERAGIKTGQSEHYLFTDDKTVFRGTARYDGKPVIAEGFVAIGINAATVSASAVTFAADAANVVNSNP